LHRELLVGSSKGCDFYAIFCEVSCELLQKLFAVLISSHRTKRLEDSWFKSLSCGNFPNTPTRCSVKCLKGYKLFFELISIVDLT
jgi:hypothetical protein